MVQLTIYKESIGLWDTQRKEIFQTEVDTIEKAIQLGQKSGAYYEVFDTQTCRMIDWNEVNIKEEDPWYYDEAELMWKKNSFRRGINSLKYSRQFKTKVILSKFQV